VHARAALGHPEPQDRARRQVQSHDQQERLAPVDDAQQHLERHAHRDRADDADRKRDRVHGRDALGGVPQHEGLERRHQADRHAEADQGARRNRFERGAGECEPEPACGGDEQQRRVDPARAEAIEQQAAGQLKQHEREEVHAREQAERTRTQPELLGERRRKNGVDRPVAVGDEVAGDERDADPRGKPAGARRRLRFGCRRAQPLGASSPPM